MSRLLDTTICPDCRGALDPSVTCTACGLQVKGPLALQLWDAMVVADGLIQRLVITRVPVLIGTGIPLFGPVPRDIVLRHVGTRQYASGLVQSEYEVVV